MKDDERFQSSNKVMMFNHCDAMKYIINDCNKNISM